jgi:dTDP-glucose 4,6-dehydratase
MKVLVYGAKGWIGQQFCEILTLNSVEYFIGESRADDFQYLEKEIKNIQPTHVISFIGRTHGIIDKKVYTTIDYLEQDGKLYENVRDNIYSPTLLAFICTKLNIHYTYLGTGCIFKFDETHLCEEKNGFTEESIPNFFGSSYSIVKGFTDKMMKLYQDSVLNLRIRMPITGEENPRNFITKIVNYDKICSVPNSMTVLPELLPKVLDMMSNGITGTLNLTNPGLISHNEILEMYREIVDPTFIWKNFSQEEQRKILSADRSNNYLDTNILEHLYPDVLNIKESVRNCLIEYKKKRDELFQQEIQQVNLLVTGGCGFIGSNFINYYFERNRFNKLVNYDIMYYCADENNVKKHIRESDKYILVNADLCNAKKIKEVLDMYNITHVIHFAAQSHVQNSFEDSIKFTHDNILGSHTLLEECRKYGKIQKFIHVSTDEVYGESMNSIDEQHKTEHSILCPTNPYAATKAGAELIAQSYCHSYKMPIIITRGNNVYGPNQYPEKLIPLFIKLLKEDKKVTIQGKGSSVRAFLHSYDTARAFECILEKGKIGEIYNIGCDEGMEYSVMEIAQILIKMIKNTEDYEKWIEYIEDRLFNDQRYYISNKKVKDLGWKITIKLMDGLKELVKINNLIERKKIIIIGGGWYGCHLASLLQDNHDVKLIEKDNDIFNGASYYNQNRLHLGFHYCRNYATRQLCKYGYNKFFKKYSSLIDKIHNNYYIISKDSIMCYDTYVNLYKKEDYDIELLENTLFDNIDGKIIKINEHVINSDRSYEYFKNLLNKVDFHFDETVLNYTQIENENTINIITDKDSHNADIVFDCTYNQLGWSKKEYIYEKTISLLFKKINDTIFDAITIMDGKFSSLYPRDIKKNIFTLTDVEFTPLIKSEDFSKINDYKVDEDTIEIIKNKMIAKFKKYYPNFENDFIYEGYFLSNKTKLISQSDSRDIIAEKISDNLITVNCGKIYGIFDLSYLF